MVKLTGFLLVLPVVFALPTAEPVTDVQDLGERQASVSIHTLFANKGKNFFGTCTDQNLLQGRSAQVIQQNFGQVTPENSMKWGSLAPNRGSYNWGQADYLANWATTNNKKIRGHTLIWHSQLPGWVNSINNANELRQVIRDHVRTTVTRFAGKIAHWDVVNEILNEQGGLRDSVFSRLLGEEFVKIAFEEARKADPNAKLYINDYNLDQANYGKVNGMVSLVTKWINAGVPIDGIGSQGHLGAGGGNAFQGALQQLATAPVTELAITELDIASAPTNDYTAVVRACLNVAKCKSITVWGVRDAVSYFNSTSAGSYYSLDQQDSWRANTNPLLFDNNFSPKPAYNGIVSLLQS